MATPPTRAQVAKYGHIAARLREVCKLHSWTPSAFNKAVGVTGAGVWLNGKGAPGPASRAKLVKVTGIVETDLMPRKPGEIPAQAVATLAGPVKPTPVRGGDVLSFMVSANGEARIKLDITLPVETATPLLRMLLDAGIVFGAD